MGKKKGKKKRSKKNKCSTKETTELAEVSAIREIEECEPKLIVTESEDNEVESELPPELILRVDADDADEDEAVEVLNDFKEIDVLTPKRPQSLRANLTKTNEAKFVEKGELPDSTERQERKWNAELSTHWWMGITGLCTVAVLVTGLIYLHSSGAIIKVDSNSELTPLVSKEDPYEESSQRWFHENMAENKKAAIDIFKRYVSATNHQERSSLMRDPDAYLKHVNGWEETFKPRPYDDVHCSWSVETNEGRSYLSLVSKNTDFMPLRAYFVYDAEYDRLKLDWHATVGWSEISINTLRTETTASEIELLKPDGETILLRCYLKKKHEFYLEPYNEREYSAFMLTAPNKTSYIWAYAKRGSALDEDLKRFLNHGRFATDLKEDKPVTLRIKNPKNAGAFTQADLVEFIHPEWISP